MDGSCSHCKHMSIAMLRSWLSFIMRLPLDSTQSGSSGHKDDRVCPATAAVLNSSPRAPPLYIFCMSLLVNTPDSDNQLVRSALHE